MYYQISQLLTSERSIPLIHASSWFYSYLVSDMWDNITYSLRVSKRDQSGPKWAVLYFSNSCPLKLPHPMFSWIVYTVQHEKIYVIKDQKKKDLCLLVLPKFMHFFMGPQRFGASVSFLQKSDNFLRLISWKPFGIFIYSLRQSCSSCHKEQIHNGVGYHMVGLDRL